MMIPPVLVPDEVALPLMILQFPLFPEIVLLGTVPNQLPLEPLRHLLPLYQARALQ